MATPLVGGACVSGAARPQCHKVQRRLRPLLPLLPVSAPRPAAPAGFSGVRAARAAPGRADESVRKAAGLRQLLGKLSPGVGASGGLFLLRSVCLWRGWGVVSNSFSLVTQPL